jgi:hypothetical protein
MRYANEENLVIDKFKQGVELDLALVVYRCHHEVGAGLFTNQLPGDDVGVVLQVCDEDLVARMQARAAKALGDQIDRFGSAAGQNDLSAGMRVYEITDLVAGTFVRLGCTMAKRVDAAMDVGVVLALIPGDGVDHCAWLLRGRGAVEVHQGLPMNGLVQRRKVSTPVCC